MRILFITIFFIQISWGQISMNDCISITHNAIEDIESNTIDNTLGFFRNPTAEAKNKIKKAAIILDLNQSQISLNETSAATKKYFINRCIYKSNAGEILLMISFYYKKESEIALIEQIEVKDKNDFISRKNIYKGNPNSLNGGGPPEALNN